MYTVQVKAIGGWTVHSEHDDLDDAIDQADLIGGRVVGMTVKSRKPWTLSEIKSAIKGDCNWHSQRGPGDVAGYERDVESFALIDGSRTWDDLSQNCPGEWMPAVVNRCHLRDL